MSHPERVLYPGAGFTKGDVVDYYVRAADALLPHVVGRPVTLVRHPKGIQAKGFFQKNVAKHFPDFIERIELPRREGVTRHPAVNDARGLAWLANQGTLEFHVPLARAPDLAHPTRLVIDFDPPEGADDDARRAALVARDLLADLGLPTVPVVTGSKGYHVVASITPTVRGWTLTKACHQLAAVLAAEHPGLMTLEFLKAERRERVFVDWMRNTMMATVVAPFSLRARPGAPVAVPIRWDELADSAPDRWTLETVSERFGIDPLLELEASPVDPQRFVDGAAGMADAAGLEVRPKDRFGRDVEWSYDR